MPMYFYRYLNKNTFNANVFYFPSAAKSSIWEMMVICYPYNV